MDRHRLRAVVRFPITARRTSRRRIRAQGSARDGLDGICRYVCAGGAAQSFSMLVAARALQGAFAALLAPAALAVLATIFTESAERGKAFGIFGAVSVSGSALGLVLGGGLTEAFSWRWTLYINLAFALPAAIAAGALLVNPPRSQTTGRIDRAGAASAAAGLFLLIFGLSHAERNGWTEPLTYGSLVGAIVLLGSFVLIESRAEQPLLPLYIPADRTRGGSYLAIACNSLGLFGTFLFLTYYLQREHGLSPLDTGLAFLPLALTIIVVATTVTSRLLPKTGPRMLLTIGPILGALGLLWLAQLNPAGGYLAHVLPALMLIGLAAGLTVAPAMSTGTSGVAAQDAGTASAAVNTSQQVGGALGLAVLSTIGAAASGFDFYATVFYVTAAIYAGAAVICGTLIPSQARRNDRG